MQGPLEGLKVIEFEGLAPTVFLGMILKDFGAQVTIINRETNSNPIGVDTHMTYLNRGKKSISLNLKNPLHIQILKSMVNKADILIDCFRPGVLESLGLGPQHIQNEKLIYTRVTGFGQLGSLKNQAGHDINYLGYSGILSTFSNFQQRPDPPNNVLADFAAGGGFGATGILLALYERTKTGKGQVVDVSLTHCSGYMGSFLHNMKLLGFWNNNRGQNVLDGGAPFYRAYKCLDNQYISVGSIEQQFYQRFLKGLGIQNIKEYLQKQFDQDTWEETQKVFQEIINKKTRDEWMNIFLPLDCCVGPVLEINELGKRKELQNFIYPQSNGEFQYAKQPMLQNHLKQNNQQQIPRRGENSIEVLKEYQIDQQIIQQYMQKNPNL